MERMVPDLEAYEGLARVYDLFQDNVDYESWCTYLTELLREEGIEDGLVLDLGCGTGTMTGLLARAGYDMIGVDHSEEMLQEAFSKKQESGLDILYLLQDMEGFELYGTVRAVVSVCDSLNYVTEEEGLRQVFRLVNNYLDPGGLFIFDMNMPCKYEQIGSRTIAEDREEASFIWENTYDPEEQINEYALALFVPREDGLYERLEEYHYQKAYPAEKVTQLLTEAGLTVEAVYDAYTRDPARPDSGRLTFIAREKGKSLPGSKPAEE